MKVSILVPVYGVEKFIERCAISLLGQTYEDLEIIFVDDCTKDRSMQILHDVLKRYPHRESQIRIVRHEKNKGLAAARNTAVSSATGEFLMHVDSDDWIDVHMVEKLVDRQKEQDADFVICGFMRHHKYYAVPFTCPACSTPDDLLCAILTDDCSPNIWGCLIRRSLYRKYDIHTEEGTNMGEDFQVKPQLVYHAKAVAVVPEILVHYNYMNEDSYSYSFSQQRVMQAWRSREIVRTFLLRNAPDYLSYMYVGDALRCVEYMKNSAYCGYKCSYDDFKRKLHGISPEYYSKISFADKIVISLSNYYLVKWYVKSARLVKRIVTTFYGKNLF